jgi:hypothetical protein
MIEVLHQTKAGKFKQLFVIQFNSFFVKDNVLRFTKDKIDGVCKDIRYPNEFFIDLIFDEMQNKNVSIYESEVTKWKSVMSDFIMKSFKQVGPVDVEEKKEEEKKPERLSHASDDKEEKDEDVTTKPNTLNKAAEILKTFSKHEEDDLEDDMEDYFKSLESKTNN